MSTRAAMLSDLLLAVSAIFLLGSCSALQGNFLAASSDLEGEQPSEVEVGFSGNESIGASALRGAVQPLMLNLSRGQNPEAAAYDGSDAIEDHYRSEGYPDVQVDWEVEGPVSRPDLPPLFTVRFSIEEGPRFTVSQMTLVGNTVDQELLLPLWERRQAGALGFGSPLFVLRDIQAFADAISTYYRALGHLEVRVEEPEVLRDEEELSAAVILRISEGRLFTFGPIAIDPGLVAALGEAMPELPEGEPFTTRRTRELLLELQARLRQLGHPDPSVRIPPFENLSSQVIELQVLGDPGRVATIADVRVEGAEATSESFIRGKLSLEVGDRYDGSIVDEAVADLYRTGVFRRAQILHEWIDEGTVRLTIEVEEAETKSIEFLAGYGSYERIRGGVAFAERNLFGTGKNLFLEGKVSTRGYRTTATVSDPDLFGSGLTGTLEGEVFKREMPSFTDQAAGGTASISRRLLPRLTGRFGYTYLPRSGSSTDVVGPAGALVDFVQGSLFTDFRYDNRDSVLSPTSGPSAFLRVEGFDESLGGDVSFLRLRAGGTEHVPLGRGYRLALRANAGWLWPGETSLQVPIQERFFNGGENTVRSFRQDQLGPKDLSGNSVGGEFRNLFTIEMRVPVYGALEGALFADAGNVGLRVQDYTLKGLSYGLGGGLRFALPIGPVRVDVAWNPDPEPEDRDWTAHLSIGYPF